MKIARNVATVSCNPEYKVTVVRYKASVVNYSNILKKSYNSDKSNDCEE